MAFALTDHGASGRAARAELAKDSHWGAPEYWRVEVISSVRRLLLSGKLDERQARQAVTWLNHLVVAPVAIADLIDRIWELRADVSAYDAAYVAAAELREATLVTGDRRLARAPGLRCDVRVV